jgi:hypothetical protein
MTVTNFRVLWLRITKTAEYYRLLWDDKKQRSDVTLMCGFIFLFKERRTRTHGWSFPVFYYQAAKTGAKRVGSTT